MNISELLEHIKSKTVFIRFQNKYLLCHRLYNEWCLIPALWSAEQDCLTHIPQADTWGYYLYALAELKIVDQLFVYWNMIAVGITMTQYEKHSLRP